MEGINIRLKELGWRLQLCFLFVLCWLLPLKIDFLFFRIYAKGEKVALKPFVLEKLIFFLFPIIWGDVLLIRKCLVVTNNFLSLFFMFNIKVIVLRLRLIFKDKVMRVRIHYKLIVYVLRIFSCKVCSWMKNMWLVI